tara:strand:+ start:579 stop:1253 length:675 start_codon:yes stop_codon:yes gene_type:complete
MIYQKYNFSNSFSNASGRGRERMALSELARLIRNYPLVVKDILESSDIKVPRNITKKGLVRIIRKNRTNEEMARKLSYLIVTNAKMKSDDFLPFFKGKKKGADASSGEKVGVFKKIGKFFKDRKARKQAEGGKEKGQFGKKVGSFFRNNQDEIIGVGSSLLSGLGSRGSGTSLNQQISQGGFNNNNTNNNNNNNDEKKMSLGTKIGIAVGGLAVVGVIIYLARR